MTTFTVQKRRVEIAVPDAVPVEVPEIELPYREASKFPLLFAEATVALYPFPDA